LRGDPPATAWELLLWNFADLFTRPSFRLFLNLISAWLPCPGRRTVTRMITVADPEGEHAHDAYHRFLRAGKWSMTPLWCRLPLLLVHKSGPLWYLARHEALPTRPGRQTWSGPAPRW